MHKVLATLLLLAEVFAFKLLDEEAMKIFEYVQRAYKQLYESD